MWPSWRASSRESSKHALGARRERNLHGDEAAAAADDLLDLDARFLERDACGENIVENIGQDRGGGGHRFGSRGAHSSAQSAAERIRSTGGGTRGERGSRRARRTHGLEDLRGDTGAFADEAEHDLRGEGARGRVSGSRSGRADAGFHPSIHRTFDLGERRRAGWGRARSARTRARGAARRARSHLLGADEVVAESAGLLLREHHDLDGLLREALRRGRARGEGKRRSVCRRRRRSASDVTRADDFAESRARGTRARPRPRPRSAPRRARSYPSRCSRTIARASGRERRSRGKETTRCREVGRRDVRRKTHLEHRGRRELSASATATR